MAVEIRTVSYYTCDAESCDWDVYREVDHDGLPTGYHGTVTQIDAEGNARGVDFYAHDWDHVPAAMSGALNRRAEAVDHSVVPEHHTVTGNIPASSRESGHRESSLGPVATDTAGNAPDNTGFSLGSE